MSATVSRTNPAGRGPAARFKLRAPASHIRPVVSFAAPLFLVIFTPCSAQSPPKVEKAPVQNRRVENARRGYVGDAACTACHATQSSAYEHTSHHLTSQSVGKQADGRNSILGSFEESKNLLMIANPETSRAEPGLYFKMEEKNGRYEQTAVTGWGKDFVSRTEPMDIVTGSGVRGQTYLYWHGERLFQLPVSYWTDGSQWINSPGYANGSADFSRPISPRCLECHATYIKPRSDDPATNRYERQSFVPGISCETCHGPGADHIAVASGGQVRSASKRRTAPQTTLKDPQSSGPPPDRIFAEIHRPGHAEPGKVFARPPGRSLRILPSWSPGRGRRSRIFLFPRRAAHQILQAHVGRPGGASRCPRQSGWATSTQPLLHFIPHDDLLDLP